MIPELGESELILIAIVALIVVGPKDLPVMLRKVGQFVAKLRGMAAEFRASFDEMARQSELDELRKEVEAMRRGQAMDMAASEAGDVQVNQIFSDIENSLKGSDVSFHPGMAASHLPQPPIEPIPELEVQAAAEAPKIKAARPPRRKPAAEGAAKPKAAAKPKTAAKPKAATKTAAKTAAAKPAPKPRKAKTGTVA